MRMKANKLQALICLVLLSIMALTNAHARNCTKGQPCGGSCISWSKVCRVGTGTSRPTAPRSATVPQTVGPSSPSSTGLSQIRPDAPSSTLAPAAGAASAATLRVRVDAAVFEWPEHSAPVIRVVGAGSQMTAYRRHNGWIRISAEKAASEWLPLTVIEQR